MEDPSTQIRELCTSWWKTRDLNKDQSLFKQNGLYYIEGSYNAERCWWWQIQQFIYSEFEYRKLDNTLHAFRPIDLDEDLFYRLISQLGVDIGLFYRDFIQIYKKYTKNTKNNNDYNKKIELVR